MQLRGRLHPREWWLNSVAASALWTPRTRARLMRMAGLDVHGSIRPGARVVGRQLVVERGAFVHMGVVFAAAEPIRIELGAALGPNVVLITGSHEIGPPHQRAGELVFAPITVRRGAWLGAGTIVHPGVTIGEGCVVASGSVVTEDLAPHGLYAGAPATRRRDLPTDAAVVDYPSADDGR